ncbi:sensor histidine kinase N-terminal domain-containing protein [Alphaproteobacteria bacterium]|jgi:two-component system sensor histidine kinase TctE|nr:sensor histidine kinase N-terminal domain-containing protein [Alphaproteobacteria bacterium]
MMSLRQRLLMFLLLPLIPLSAFLIGMIYWAIRSATTESYDRVLEGSALAIADRVVLENGSLVVDLPYAALQMLTNSAEDRVFYSVQKWPSGEVVTGYRNLLAPTFGESDKVLQQIDFRGEPMRMIAIKDEALSYSASVEFVVLIAETLGQRTNVLQLYLRYAILAFVVGVLMISLLTLYAVNFGLRPLRNLADAVSQRSERDLRAIRRPVPPEGQPLVDEINALFGRLEKTLNSHRHFVSNTAHQLRTPLAELKTELEVATMEGTQPDLPGLSKRIDHLAHLVQQMMLLSRVGVQPSNRDDSFGAVNLEELAQKAVEDWSLRAYRAGVDLGLQVEASVSVSGHSALLLEALGNLIDNIIKHARGATTATITVRKDRLIVTDDGSGFRAKGSSEPSVQRFGLSIVEEIMDLHKGWTEKDTGKNAKVTLIFPASALTETTP